MPTAESSRICAVCGADITHKSLTAKFCSAKCKDKFRDLRMRPNPCVRKLETLKQREAARYYEKNKEMLRAKARERMRRLKEHRGFYAHVQARKQFDGRRLFDAHVKAWVKTRVKTRSHERRYARNHYGKHCAHVSAWKNYLRANPGAAARYFKSIGKPWLNRHLSKAQQYKIKYHLDVEFRLGEINRSTWRKEQLNARNDNTIDFAKLMRERKTCPYCGCLITKENAVADHMDPLSRGGANSDHNLTICCKTCNKKKSAKPFVEWVAMLPANRREAARRWYRRKHGHWPEDHHQGFVFEFAA